MTTKLSAPFKRELEVNGEKYTLTLTPEGFRLVLKGKRKGIELAWAAIVGGDAALSSALNATLAHRPRSARGEDMGRNPTKH